MIGVATKPVTNPSALINAETFPTTYGVGARYNGYVAGISGEIQAVSGFSWVANDVIGIALDADNGAVYYSKNGIWLNSGNPTS
ncbi:MAG: Concanavalin A-like lectin/glucanase superfamily [Patescibacteria group bacterium]|nr:Concanavalin A-like lectin/glucanase superfamily [Patescibacteria group bacterium]